jgi:recombinase
MTLIFIFEFDFVRTGLFDRVDTKVLMSDKSEPYCKGGFAFNAKKDYTTLVDEIDILRDKKHELQVQRAETEGVKKRIEELTDFLKGENNQLIEYDEGMVRKYIEEIKVHEGKFTIRFKAKVEIEVVR